MRQASLSLVLLLLAGSVLAGPAEAVTAAAADLRTVAVEDRRNALYLWYPRKDHAAFYVALKLRLNELSNVPEMVDAVEIEPGLWRIDITDLDLKRANLDRAAEVEHHFHERIKVKTRAPAKKVKRRMGARKMARAKGTTREVSAVAGWLPKRDITFLIRATRAKAPILNAEWFYARTGRADSLQGQADGFGWYEVLGVANRADFFERVGLDEKRAIRSLREFRAALEAGNGKFSSRLNASGRQVGVFDTLQGKTWFTLDTDNPSGKGIATNNLRRGEFRHKAEEYIGHARNGLWQGLLCDDKGVIQRSAPDFVGHNNAPLNRNANKKILQQRCRECHTEVIQDVGQGGVDWVRWTFRQPPKGKKGPKLGSADRRVQKEQERQYLSDLAAAIDDDRKLHARAVQLATVTRTTPKGLTLKEAARVEAEHYHRYATDEVTIAQLADELGCTVKQLADALAARSSTVIGLDTDLAPLVRDPPGTVSRLVVEDRYRALQYYLRGIDPP